MTVHVLHIRKSGGTALNHALKQAHKRAGYQLQSPFGEVIKHKHSVRLDDVPDGDHAVFAVRDPATRFVSGFYSRLRKGAPRHNREWTDAERRSFTWFATPQELADALASPWPWKRKRAKFAMESINHLKKPLVWWTGPAAEFRGKLHKVLYIARQETLDEDWPRLRSLLALPSHIELPSDPIQAHRFTGSDDRSLTPEMVDAIKEWYADDYRLLEAIDEARVDMIARAESAGASETSPR